MRNYSSNESSNKVACVPTRTPSVASGERPRSGLERDADSFNLSLGKTCGPPTSELIQLEVSACRCKSIACSSCGYGVAWKEAKLLEEKLASMQHPMLLTLTVDPEWGTPREVFDRLAEKRAVGEFIRSLKKKGFITGEWYRATEFQMGKRSGSEGTEQVHFHLIVDTINGFVPHAYMMQRWHQLARLCFGDPKPGREAYGFVQFEQIKREAIAFYVCSYLSDASKKGLPDWYLDRCNETGPNGAKYNVTLKTHSRGLFGTAKAPDTPEYEEGEKPTKKRIRRTLNERLMHCKDKANLLAVILELAPDGEIVRTTREWLGEIRSFLSAYIYSFGWSQDPEQEHWQHALGAGGFETSPDLVIGMRNQGLLNSLSSKVDLWLSRVREDQPNALRRRNTSDP